MQNFDIYRMNIKKTKAKIKIWIKKGKRPNDGGCQIIAAEEKRSIILQHLVAIEKIKQIKEEEMNFLKMKKIIFEENLMILGLNSIRANQTEKD